MVHIAEFQSFLLGYSLIWFSFFYRRVNSFILRITVPFAAFEATKGLLFKDIKLFHLFTLSSSVVQKVHKIVKMGKMHLDSKFKMSLSCYTTREEGNYLWMQLYCKIPLNRLLWAVLKAFG